MSVENEKSAYIAKKNYFSYFVLRFTKLKTVHGVHYCKSEVDRI